MKAVLQSNLLSRCSPDFHDISAYLIFFCLLGFWQHVPTTFAMAALFTSQALRAVGVLLSPMVSGWASGQAFIRGVGGGGLSGLYLRNPKVQEVDTW